MPGVDELAVQLAGISARLKEEGDGGLTRRLSQGIGRALEPVEQDIRDGLRPRLPDRYADVIASELDVFRRTSTSGDESRVTVYARTAGDAQRKLRRLDNGALWHPLFGRFPRLDPRNRWFEMREPHVRPGWFTGPVEAAAPRVRREIEDALNDVTERIAGR